MTSAVRVVPAVPAFAVDRGFWYSVPAHLEGRVGLGAKVRVPLGSGHTHGYVVECDDRPPLKLKPLSSMSGDTAVFDAALLSVCRWAAHYYVSPLSTMLAKTAPPNAPRSAAGDEPDPLPPPGEVDHPAGLLGEDAASGRRRRPGCLLMNPAGGEWVQPMLGPVLRSGRSALVVVPTAAEEEQMTALLHGDFPGRVMGASSRHDDRHKTKVWGRLAVQPGMVLVATPAAALWPIQRHGLLVVVEDGRRAHQSRRTPTVGTRRLLRERSIREGGLLVNVGALPSVDFMAFGPDLYHSRRRRRLWPHIEVVDRRSADVSGLFHPLTLAALRTSAEAGGAFVFAHRRGYAPAMRCAACRTLRRCPECGGRAAKGEACQRCGVPLGRCRKCGAGYFEPLGAGVGRVRAELQKRFGKGWIGTVGDQAPITVGTEASLAGAGVFDLVVVVDADGLFFAPHYRADEEALRIMVRLAGRLSEGSGRRLLLQTSIPGHRVTSALRKGEGVAFLQEELDLRIATGFPPQGQLLALQVRGTALEEASSRMREEMAVLEDSKTSVHGPVELAGGRGELVECEGGAAWSGESLAAAGSDGAGGCRSPRLVGLGRLMAVLPIRVFGDPILRTVSVPVGDIDSRTRNLCNDMIDTMYDAPGVGLAAPQVGVGLRVFVFDIQDDQGPRAIVNPELLRTWGEWEYDEGCLSVPEYFWPIRRPAGAVVKGWDLDGNEVEYGGDELLGRVLQHELDHLNGTLLLERLERRVRRRALRVIREEALG